MPSSKTEQEQRAKLGIPADAEKVLIIGETSHWDPNWLYTAEEYYKKRTRQTMEEVLHELEREPRRIYTVECTFFLKYFWDREEACRDRIRDLVNAGRIRLSGTGVTTPDTLLPDPEAILRDYLLGQEWLRQNGMDAEPRLAYLPDDFGHSPALPSLLQALGFDKACVTRIDGMYFIGSDLRLPSSFPQAGSSAEALLKEHGSLDFVWRAPDGAEVLTHWNAFTYFQGDMLASLGIIRWMGRTFGIDWRSERHIARRIKGFVRQLAPVARTPYLFCPIGCDFNGPIRDLLTLTDRYNETRFQDTGVWVVNAAMEDYLELVDHYRVELPTLTLDPNPYWMGFYASRPEAKQLCNRITRKLVLGESLSALDAPAPARGSATVGRGGQATPQRTVHGRLGAAWDLVVVSNHHDFITGTSPDRVWVNEQLKWLQGAEALAQGALEQVRAGVNGAPPPGAAKISTAPQWHLDQGRLEVTVDGHYHLVLEAEAGGCLTSLRYGGPDGEQILSGPGNDLVSYHDSGGLWRMGHEFRGGTFKERQRASTQPAEVEAREVGGVLEVRVASQLDGRPMTRWLWMEAGSPIIRMRLLGAAARRRSVTCSLPTRLRTRELSMDVAGGVVTRPSHKLFAPTFWPARSVAHIRNSGNGGHEAGVALFMGGPACVSLDHGGVLSWVALRNARREVAWGFVPIPAHPASGRDDAPHAMDYALMLTPTGDLVQNRLPHLSRDILLPAWLDEEDGDGLGRRLHELVRADRDDVLLATLKPAHRGAGVIARLESLAPAGTRARLRLGSDAHTIKEATLCDARERDLSPLTVEDGQVAVPLAGAITSVRFIV